MPHVYAKVDELEGTDKVGSHQCVALLQHYGGLPSTIRWFEGKKVMGDSTIAKGTAIATFVGGEYRSLRSGNHAAFYLSQDATGIWIMDQWADDKSKPKVSKRHVRRRGKDKSGKFLDPSNNADAYSVIE